MPSLRMPSSSILFTLQFFALHLTKKISLRLLCFLLMPVLLISYYHNQAAQQNFPTILQTFLHFCLFLYHRLRAISSSNPELPGSSTIIPFLITRSKLIIACSFYKNFIKTNKCSALLCCTIFI